MVKLYTYREYLDVDGERSLQLVEHLAYDVIQAKIEDLERRHTITVQQLNGAYNVTVFW